MINLSNDMHNHSVIIVPGLGDRIQLTMLATYTWRRSGLRPIVHSFAWKNSDESFELKLQCLLRCIDRELSHNRTVSLIGSSAGGSAVVNAFQKRKSQIHKVVNICGRLRRGEIDGPRAFSRATAGYPSFADSVRTSERFLNIMPTSLAARFLTIRPQFGDEIVPPNTTTIMGARNMTIPTGEHMLSIALAYTLFRNQIINFLQS